MYMSSTLFTALFSCAISYLLVKSVKVFYRLPPMSEVILSTCLPLLDWSIIFTEKSDCDKVNQGSLSQTIADDLMVCLFICTFEDMYFTS